ncbi:MAG: energy transducer TonB [Bacteroidaceae bacterium]|nr:energy transducer TonB [Bacteroidaceae bacterium]MBR1790801.1 energy transducer TonB [Bacteroidaceae bacterium]
MLYIIKANLILALLCLLFQVLMHRDTFFGVRRLMLWGIYATAFLLPLCNLQALLTADTAATDMAEAYASYVLPTLNVTAMRVASFGVEQNEPGCGMWFVGMMALWGLIYLIPVVWMTAKLLMQVAYLIYLRCTCKRVKSEGVNARPHGTLDPSRSEKYESPNTTEDKGNSYSSLGGEADIFHSSFYYFPRPCSPFSFGSWIFIHPEGMDEQTLREVLIHEQAHVRGWHTLDILFSQLVCILFWWNPAAWVMRREVRLNLEFIADAAVIGRQADKREYQYRLLGFSTQTNVAAIANNFNVLPLKRRITMMNLRRTRRTGMIKYTLFMPVAAALLFACNLDSLARTIAETVKKPLMIVDGKRVSEAEIHALPPEQIDNITVFKETSAQALYGDKGKDGAVVIEMKRVREQATATEQVDNTKAPTVQPTIAEADNEIYDEAEQKPRFPGGDAAFNQYIAQHVRYPKAAAENGVEGSVKVQFIVEADGRITHVHAIDSPSEEADAIVYAYGESDKHPSLDEDDEGHRALREAAEELFRGMPPFEPGLQNGKPVRVKMTNTVNYGLR